MKKSVKTMPLKSVFPTKGAVKKSVPPKTVVPTPKKAC